MSILPEPAAAIPLPAGMARLTIAERIARVIRRTGDTVTRRDFRRAPETCDLTEAELEAHIGEASRLLDPDVERQVEAARPERVVHPWNWDRDYRRERVAGAARLAAAMPSGQRHTALREAGYSNLELAELWPEIADAMAWLSVEGAC